MAEDRMLSDEILLGLIKKKGGGGGTTNYNDLSNKPQIAGNTLSGDKSLVDLGIASAQSVSNITNGESINNFAGVEDALSNKQGKLTAGRYIEISNSEVSVNRYAIPAGDIVYKVITGNYSSGEICYVDKYKSDGSFIERITVNPNLYGTQDVDGYIRIKKEWNRWEISLLAASKEQSAGYQYAVNPKTTETENSFTFTIPQVEDDNDLIIRSELATKQNILTFDNVPTENSTNPVKSGGVYSALTEKQNAMTAGDYISIANNEISVDREIPSVIAEYEIKTEPMVEGQAFISVTKTVNGEVVLTQKYGSNTAGIGQGINFDENIYVDYSKTIAWRWTYKLRNASVDHAANYTQSWNYSSTVDYTEEFVVTDHSGDKLVIKSEMDTALAELAADIAEKLPTAPTTDEAYVLKVTVAAGTPTYSWESST